MRRQTPITALREPLSAASTTDEPPVPTPLGAHPGHIEEELEDATASTHRRLMGGRYPGGRLRAVTALLDAAAIGLCALLDEVLGSSAAALVVGGQ